MPRNARRKSEKQVYHIMLRGNNKERIFNDEEDKLRIIDTLAEKKKSEEYYLYAYCVMDNHIHMIIKEGKDPIACIVKRIAASYSYYFNKKYKRIGHVFQERFKSESIEDDSYLLSAVRYIHQNPIKPGIGTVAGYRWSSYGDYINGFLKQKGVGINDLGGPACKPVREEIVRLLLEKSSLSQRGIAASLSLNREMVRKIAVSMDMSP